MIKKILILLEKRILELEKYTEKKKDTCYTTIKSLGSSSLQKNNYTLFNK